MKIFVLDYYTEKGRKVTRIFSTLDEAVKCLEQWNNREKINSGSIKRYEDRIDSEFLVTSNCYRVEFGKIIKCK